MYPIILSIVAISVVIFLLVVVMPTFIGMFEESGTTLPTPTRILLTISDWLTNYWYLFIGVVLILIFGIITLGKSKEGRRFF